MPLARMARYAAWISRPRVRARRRTRKRRWRQRKRVDREARGTARVRAGLRAGATRGGERSERHAVRVCRAWRPRISPPHIGFRDARALLSRRGQRVAIAPRRVDLRCWQADATLARDARELAEARCVAAAARRRRSRSDRGPRASRRFLRMALDGCRRGKRDAQRNGRSSGLEQEGTRFSEVPTACAKVSRAGIAEPRCRCGRSAIASGYADLGDVQPRVQATGRHAPGNLAPNDRRLNKIFPESCGELMLSPAFGGGGWWGWGRRASTPASLPIPARALRREALASRSTANPVHRGVHCASRTRLGERLVRVGTR